MTDHCPGCQTAPRDVSDRHGFCPSCKSVAQQIANAKLQAAHAFLLQRGWPGVDLNQEQP
jgi:uncharacterized paraquat-inducible protein A